MKQLIFLLTWWRVLPHCSLSSLDKDIMDLLNTKQETFMPDLVDTWFEKEPVPPCRCCGLIGAHYDCFSKSNKTPPEKEPKDLITATNKADSPDFLTSDVTLCQPVGTLPAQHVCFKDAIEPQHNNSRRQLLFALNL